MADDLTSRVSAKKNTKSSGKARGVYSEISPALFKRLEARRKLNRQRNLNLDSNYKIIEAAIEMLLNHFDTLDRSDQEAS